MAKIEPHPVHPKRVDPAHWGEVGFDYDDVSDTFTVYLFGLERPSKVLHTDQFFDTLVDPTTEEIVGYQIEGFLTYAVYQHPWLLPFALYTDIPTDTLRAIRDRVMRADRVSLAELAESFESLAGVALRSA